jgi:hypothetical protein
MNATDQTSLLTQILDMMKSFDERLERMEAHQRSNTPKEAYTTAEFAKRVKVTEYTVREWLKAGKVQGKKVHGKGRQGEWPIPHEELLRFQREGQSEAGTFDNKKAA